MSRSRRYLPPEHSEPSGSRGVVHAVAAPSDDDEEPTRIEPLTPDKVAIGAAGRGAVLSSGVVERISDGSDSANPAAHDDGRGFGQPALPRLSDDEPSLPSMERTQLMVNAPQRISSPDAAAPSHPRFGVEVVPADAEDPTCLMPSPIKDGDHASGEIIDGKWVVERTLGTGGMGQVVAARHVELDQVVAIKILRKELLGDAEAVTRFKREARTTAHLKSRHFVRVHDVGRLEGGIPYIVMELLDGESLSEIARIDGVLPIDQCIRWTKQAAHALAEAHSLGIVHRDVKPNNLFIANDGGEQRLYVLDFGLAKTQPIFGRDGHLTKTRQFLGTPTFMAPEQIESSRRVDARTDVWALGATLYELLAGRPPFVGPNALMLCNMILREAPAPLRTVRPDVPPWLERVIARCLEKNPDARFQSMSELEAALDAPVEVTEAMRSARETVRVAEALGLPLPPPSSSRRLEATAKRSRSSPAARSPSSPWQFPHLRLVVALAFAALTVLVLGLIIANEIATDRVKRPPTSSPTSDKSPGR